MVGSVAWRSAWWPATTGAAAVTGRRCWFGFLEEGLPRQAQRTSGAGAWGTAAQVHRSSRLLQHGGRRTFCAPVLHTAVVSSRSSSSSWRRLYSSQPPRPGDLPLSFVINLSEPAKDKELKEEEKDGEKEGEEKTKDETLENKEETSGETEAKGSESEGLGPGKPGEPGEPGKEPEKDDQGKESENKDAEKTDDTKDAKDTKDKDDADPGLPSSVESRRSLWGARFSGFMDDFQSRVLTASQALNDLTGYSAIEQIKKRNAALETRLAEAQEELHTARRAYQAVNEKRASTQREVTTLLARKDSWAPADLERFTALYRADHELEAAAARSVETLAEAETTESKLSADLTSGILKRYHEEQVWSDRIRRQSTWGTWGLMAVNVVLFIVLQFFAEPWKRRRLMRGIAAAETGVLDDVRRELAEVRTALDEFRAAAGEGGEVAGVVAEGALTVEPETELIQGEIQAEAQSETQPDQPVTEPTDEPAMVFTPGQEAPEPTVNTETETESETKSDSETDTPTTPPWWKLDVDVTRAKTWLADLASDRQVQLRMRDVSLLAVESAATGAAVVGAVVIFFWRS